LIRIRPPGLAGCYDTYGITLAGHLIELVSGQTYPDYLRVSIFAPLGMSSTGVQFAGADAAVGSEVSKEVHRIGGATKNSEAVRKPVKN
jgi:CubicO group peptidase (beta-lactamase class C family)